MLKAVMKALGADTEQVAPVEDAVANMTTEVFGSEALLEQLSEANELIAANQNTIATMANEIEGYKGNLAKLQDELANLQSYADEAQAKALAAAEELKAKELSDKREQLADVIGKDNPGFDVTFAALQSLNAEAFGVVLAGFRASFEAEAKGPLFNEVGVSGECDLSGLKEEESETARLIKQNYQNQ